MKLLIFFSCFLSSVICDAVDTSEAYSRKVHAHLLIHDKHSACEMGRQGVLSYNNDAQIWEAYITALAEAGFEKEMISAWQHYFILNPKAFENRKLIENMAWGVIRKASYSDSPIIRIYSILGAFYANDARGVQILNRLIRDSNTLTRLAAIQLSSRLRDASLCDSIAQAYLKEHCTENRIEIIKAIGNMKLKALKPQLVAILVNQKSSAEEKAAAIESIIHLMDTVERNEILHLATSDRAGLRLLASHAVAHFELTNELDLLLPLLKDNSSEVRATVLQHLGTLRVDNINDTKVVDIASSMIVDRDPHVAISAAWLLTLHDPEKGQKAFFPWFSHANSEIRILAATALGSAGKYAFPLIVPMFKQSKDKFVKLNLAHALLVNRSNLPEASETLFEAIKNQKEKLDWEKNGIFRSIISSKKNYSDNPDENPVVLSQIVKLEILNLLALVKYSNAQEAVLTFLKQKNWGISGMAAALLLTEGDENAVDIVKELLTYPVYKVRVQAAIILALWGQGEDALKVLQEAYFEGDREDKERIVEAIGRVSVSSSIPFLLQQLNEPSQKLRIIVACALLECLYN